MSIREVTAWALGEIGAPIALPRLLAVFEDASEHNYVYLAASKAMGKIGDPSAIPMLLTSLHTKGEGDLRLQNAIIETLGEIGDAATVKTLIPYLSDT